MITLQELRSDSRASKAIDEKRVATSFGIEDVRDEVTRLTRQTPRDPQEVRLFLESRKALIRSHAGLPPAEKQRAIAHVEEIMSGGKVTLPTPGGVGYGVIYDQSLRSSFGTGTVLTVNYICPDKPGGNVSNTVYLTATNRSARGVEALMHYQAQNLVEFRVYDWARPGQEWQVTLNHAALADYFYPITIGGKTYQTVTVNNFTYQARTDGTWRNDVLLFNRRKVFVYDLVYRYEYPSTPAQQQGASVGWWGPIVETFQDSYSNTQPLGFIWAQVLTRTTEIGEWVTVLGWQNLTPSNSWIRQDNKGFVIVYQQPDTDLIVEGKPG
jgi:hypothetical protein